MNITILSLILGVLGLAIGYSLQTLITQARRQKAEKKAEKILKKAKKEREDLLEKAQKEAQEIKKSAEKKAEDQEKYLKETESALRRKEAFLEEKEKELREKLERQEKIEEEIVKQKQEIETLKEEEKKILQQVAGLKKEKAKEMLFKAIEEEYEEELARLVKKKEEEAKEEGDRKAQKILATIINRLAQDFTAEHTVSAVQLSSDEMKGRIIGREGRNIQTFERLTGVDLIIDDTPEVVTISSFDPVRREIARIALERLVADGRIHPARIEETVKKAEEEVNKQIKEAGEQAVYELGLPRLHSDLSKLLGRLKFRTSYGQNVLQHSIEVARIAGMLAEELGADVNIAKTAGLLHDIGKAVDHEIPGSHAQIGKDILKKYGIAKEIISAVAAHHEEQEPKTTEDWIVMTADMISGARPGARRETAEEYLKRIQELENIATSFKGTQRAYAIQAGREVRVFVEPEKISDYEAKKLAKNIAKKIEKETKYPGEIKVITIRETRAEEIAR